ncbi:MAG: class I SAM-dependent methyltransferase [Vicinamibacterales bacterium]
MTLSWLPASASRRWAKAAFLKSLEHFSGGHLTIAGRDGIWRVGSSDAELRGTLIVHDDRFFVRALAEGDIGIGESYMAGEWSTPDLVTLARLMVRNLGAIDGQGGSARALHRLVAGLARRLRDNTVDGSREHIRRHYDLGNEFFRLFLDSHLMYSCAFYVSPSDTLEKAQEQKLDRICQRLRLGPADHVLEIGTGWGGFAVWAATRYGCRVTSTTISAEQYRYARELVARLGDAGRRIELLQHDYRWLEGQYDKIVSIEMFEAVGLRHYDEYFGAVDRLLRPNGSMLLQTITLDEQWFPSYVRQPDWIEKYIFPGGELASIGHILGSLARVTGMSLYHAENIGMHYAYTLRAWRERFHRRLSDVRALGFDEPFIRMWDLYLGYCEAAFLERHAGDFQMVLGKNRMMAPLLNEPWPVATTTRDAVA